MKISELINTLADISTRFGDLPCGGECDIGVKLTVCDDEGHDVELGFDY